MADSMDFLKALKEAEAAGISGQQFLKIWDYETKIKQEPEFIKTENAPEVKSAASLIEAQLQKFSLDQRRVLTNLREDLQAQNQALVTDISRLLQGFASLVGKVVKGEIETALEGLNLSASGNSSNYGTQTSSQAAQATGTSNRGSGRTWSKVHEEQSSSSDEVDYTPDQINVEDIIQHAGQNLAKKKKPRKGKKQQAVNQKINPKPQTSREQQKKSPETEEMPTFSSLIKDLKKGKDVDPSVHFFPEDGSANMVVFDVFEVASAGIISKSPVYYLQDCPFKVQLLLGFDIESELSISVTFWGLSPTPLALPRAFTISGEIKNKNSLAYSSLFMERSPPLQLHRSISQKVALPLMLKTAKGSFHKINLEMLKLRNYIFEEKHSISIRWKILSQEA